MPSKMHKLGRWQSSDLRMDTAHCILSKAALNYNVFQNICGMPIIIEFYTNRIENLKPSISDPDKYEGIEHIGYIIQNGQIERESKPITLNKDDVVFVKSYYPGFFAKTSPSAFVQYWSFRAFLKKENPNQLIGSYITGSNCRDHISQDLFPRDIIDCHCITPLGHLGLNPTKAIEVIDEGRWFIHPDDSQNIEKYQDIIVEEAVQRNCDFLYLDNMHCISFRDFIKVDEIAFGKGFLSHISSLSNRLNEMGYGVVYNLGMLPYWPLRTNDLVICKELENIFEAAVGNNGILLEIPFRYRDDQKLTQWEMNKLRSLLKQGALVVLSPHPEGYSDIARAEWTSAIALLIRESGDSLFVCTDQDIDSAINHWKDWAAWYGKPNDSTFTFKINQNNHNDWYAMRRFELGKKITVVHIHVPWKNEMKSVEKDLPVSASGYEIIPEREPLQGDWKASTQKYVVANPQLDSDRFILGRNPDKTRTFYKEIIAVDITFEQLI